MSALWSPQQREWLRAMGHQVLALAGDEAVEADPVVTEPAMVPQVPVRPSAPRRTLPVERVEPVEAAAAARAPAAAPDDAERRLYRALLRATGQRTTRAAEALLQRLDVDLAALRDDPAAKRALWPRLRALRKAAGRS